MDRRWLLLDTRDLLNWEHALFGGNVVSPTSFKMMTTPGKGNYGFGVSVNRNGKVTVISYSGGIERFSSRMDYVPERRIVVIVLGNVASGSAAQALGDELVELALDRSITVASERKTVWIDASEVAGCPFELLLVLVGRAAIRECDGNNGAA